MHRAAAVCLLNISMCECCIFSQNVSYAHSTQLTRVNKVSIVVHTERTLM